MLVIAFGAEQIKKVSIEELEKKRNKTMNSFIFVFQKYELKKLIK